MPLNFHLVTKKITGGMVTDYLGTEGKVKQSTKKTSVNSTKIF